MITDESDPRMIRAHQALMTRLGRVIGDGRHPLTKPFLDRLFEVVRDHRTYWRNEGVDFPVLVALVVPRLGIVEFKRADLDLESIKVSIVNFVRFHPNATMEEVVTAFRTAYPDLHPGDVVQKREDALAAQERMLARARKHLSTPPESDNHDPEQTKE